MKAIVLAGDSGDVLSPLTKVIPKQLIPIYDRPMVYYPVKMLIDSGITQILVITTSKHKVLFKNYLGNGETYNVQISYACQDKPNGIAEAISIGREFIKGDSVCLVTGDTVLSNVNMPALMKKAYKAVANSGSATIFIKNEQDDRQYGRVLLNEYGKCENIVGGDKTSFYNSIIGIYVYPKDVISKVDKLSLSERGRYEITELNNIYFENKKLQVLSLGKETLWWDTNSFDNILRCSLYYQHQNKK